MNVQTLFILLVLFQLKHFFADYPLQRRFMLGKFLPGWAFVLPLLAHVAVHALFTFAITCCFGVKQALCFALFDAVIHFVMDRMKASHKLLGRFTSLTQQTAPTATKAQWRENDCFWWSLGFDQLVHHMTHYVILFYLFTR